jgi:hypothetical protein
MADKPEKPKLEIVPEQEPDEDEQEFTRMRRDLAGVKGASAVGIVSIGVSKLPGKGKNEFFRTHPDFRPVIPLVNTEVGMEQQYFSVTDDMVQALAGIGITVSDNTLYLTVSAEGTVRVVPVPCASENDYNRTRELGLIAGIKGWFRLYTDKPNGCYKVFPAPAGRFAEPIWPDLSQAKVFRLAFRDKGRLIDSVDHPLFQKWAARDR